MHPKVSLPSMILTAIAIMATGLIAVVRVLADVFRIKHFTKTTHADHELLWSPRPRTFGSFGKAFAKAAFLTLSSGIHFWLDIDDQFTGGQCIGQAIRGRGSFKDNDGRGQVIRCAPSSCHVGERHPRSTRDVVKPYNKHCLKGDVT